MDNCKNCSGGCGGCGGCGRQMELHPKEVVFLQKLAQIPFLPVARKTGDPTPVYLEDAEMTKEDYSLVLQCLEKKQLVSLNFDAPLKGADMRRYEDYPVHGSVALTARGIQVLELLQIQGME